MNIKSIVVILILLTACYKSDCQIKIEKEHRIEQSKLPIPVLEAINILNINSKIKWYTEESNHNISYEGKVKLHKKKYSIEFSKIGTLEDIEIKVNQNSIPSFILDSLESHIGSKFKRFRIVKVQVQFFSSLFDIRIYFPELLSSPLERNYEIEVSCLKEGEYQLYEFLLNERGNIIHEVPIELNSTDNIDY